jgi:hypothetical protein
VAVLLPLHLGGRENAPMLNGEEIAIRIAPKKKVEFSLRRRCRSACPSAFFDGRHLGDRRSAGLAGVDDLRETMRLSS